MGYPEWMHDFTAQMIRDDHANYMRWMHVTPQKEDVESFDRFGIVEVAPAADKEEDAQGQQWEQRIAVMRDSIIYLRNNPSILFWEAGNTGVTGPQMEQMVALRKQFDPNGGRTMGCRSLTQPGAVAVAEWWGTMLGGPYNDSVRDREPIVETEDFRDEGARRFWDDFSPLLRIQEGAERHLELQLGDLRRRAGQAILEVLFQPHLQHRPGHANRCLRIHLLHR